MSSSQKTNAASLAASIKQKNQNAIRAAIAATPTGPAKGVARPVGGGTVAPGTVAPNGSVVGGPTAAVNPLYEGAYQDSLSNASTAYGNQIAGDTYGEDTTANDYGFTLARGGDGTVDYGATIAGGVDPSNPFSKMALLSRAYQQQQGQTTNGYAAMGQLYSSAIGDQRNVDKFSNDQNVDATQKAFRDAIQGYTQDRRSAQDTRNNAGVSAAWSRLQAYSGGS